MALKSAKSISQTFLIHIVVLSSASLLFLTMPYMRPTQLTLSCSVSKDLPWWGLAKTAYVGCNAGNVYRLCGLYHIFTILISVLITLVNFRGFRFRLPISLFKEPQYILRFFFLYSAFLYYSYNWFVCTRAYAFEINMATPYMIYNYISIILFSCLVIPTFSFISPFLFGTPKVGYFNIEPVKTEAVRIYTYKRPDEGN